MIELGQSQLDLSLGRLFFNQTASTQQSPVCTALQSKPLSWRFFLRQSKKQAPIVESSQTESFIKSLLAFIKECFIIHYIAANIHSSKVSPAKGDNMQAKELARQFIQQRAVNRAPLPSQDEIKRQLGFGLIAAERKKGELK